MDKIDLDPDVGEKALEVMNELPEAPRITTAEPLIPSSLIPMAFANGCFLMALQDHKLCPWLNLQKYLLTLGVVSLALVMSENSVRKILFWMSLYQYRGTFLLTFFTVWTFVLRALQIGFVTVMTAVILANIGKWQYEDKAEPFYCQLGTLIFVLGAVVTCCVVCVVFAVVKVILACDKSAKLFDVVDYVIVEQEEEH